MALNRKNTIKIILILFISILFFSMIQNFAIIVAVLRKMLLILSPLILGLCIAFIINVPMRFFETKVFAKANKKNRKLWVRLRRPVCLLLSILLILGIMTIFMFLIIPEVKRTVVTVVEELPSKVERLTESVNGWIERFNLSYDAIDKYDIDWNTISTSILERFKDGSTTVINTTIDMTSSVLSSLFNIILGFVFSIYLLASKEKLTVQARKLIYALIPEKTATSFFEITALSNSIFSKFVIGQCVEALILGTLCYIGMMIFSIPYAMMISSLIAITALVPVFGAFIGTAVGALMILLQSPIQAFWFIVFITVLQQLESNIIYPKIVGNSVGLPGIWVLFAVTTGGSLFGAIGMLVSVPLCAVLYCLLQEFVNKRLKERDVNELLYSKKE